MSVARKERAGERTPRGETRVSRRCARELLCAQRECRAAVVRRVKECLRRTSRHRPDARSVQEFLRDVPNRIGRRFDDLGMQVALGCVVIDEDPELSAVFGEEAACEIGRRAVPFGAIALEMNGLNWECEYLRANLYLDITKEACVLP